MYSITFNITVKGKENVQDIAEWLGAKLVNYASNGHQASISVVPVNDDEDPYKRDLADDLKYAIELAVLDENCKNRLFRALTDTNILLRS